MTTSKTADKHSLYQQSVQDPPSDIKFVDRVFRAKNGRAPQSLREDFCGTALLCADWVRKGPKRRALGIDLDAPVLRWAKRHNLAPLGERAHRVQVLQQDVLKATGQSFDVVVAFNFSYCVFLQRAQMLRYFQAVRGELAPGGGFLMDIHGGTEVTVEVEEETEHEDFSYIWQQCPYDAISGKSMRYIHFGFPDGSKMQRAFSYNWRLWTLPELRDLLEEAGFSEVEVYWEGADEDGAGNGQFRKTKKAMQEESWIAYIAAWN